MHQGHSVKEVQNDSVEQTASALLKPAAGEVIEDISRWSYRRYQHKILKILSIVEKPAEEETPADQSAEVVKTRYEEKMKEEYYVWKIRMQAHLAAQNDDMWEVITNRPLKIMKANPAFAITGGAPEWIEKSRVEYTTEDKKKANLDNVAKDILYKTLENDMFSYIITCATAKEIWEKLTQICESNDRKVFVAEESNKHWADSDSDYISSSSSSSDSEQEEVNCLMANDSMEDEVFDFSNDKFTREELISALNEMVNEYKILSQTFEEVNPYLVNSNHRRLRASSWYQI
ncbi:hypothetical protein F511_09275 [Dorcoceras hygrometricum]|uniref:Uncharacterized protein n=1 Tax=Dorcoceras hygrometricum TaxID=472368 RepID=A0A2Z7B1Z4_9LAMI|nr:hypothetical protein F511_09275 [Dorcoceras hygrometricum]